MPVLMWDKPKKKMATEQWRESAGFDGGPSGGYQPNMDVADELRWKAKITGTKLGFPQVEIRKRAGDSLMLVIVNLGAGYNYKSAVAGYSTEEAQANIARGYNAGIALAHHALKQENTDGINLHISMNGPARMNFQDFADMQVAIEEARLALEELETAPGERRLRFIRVVGDPASYEEGLTEIPGVRFHNAFAEIDLVVASSPESSLRDIVKLPGVVEIRSRQDVRWDAYCAFGYDRFTKKEDL